MTSRSEVHHANHYSIEASYKKEQILYVELYNVLLFCEVKIEMHVTYNEWILVFFSKFWFKTYMTKTVTIVEIACYWPKLTQNLEKM